MLVKNKFLLYQNEYQQILNLTKGSLKDKKTCFEELFKCV